MVFIKKIILLIVLIVTTPFILAQKWQAPLEMKIEKVDLDLLLKKDGSVDVTQENLETYYLNISQELDPVITFEISIAKVKSLANLEIYDLSYQEIKRLVEVSKFLNFNCDGRYIFDNVNNKITICTKTNKDRILHFKIKYTLLQDVTCKEIERVQQTFSYQSPQQEEPYEIVYKTRAEEGLNYLGPLNCPPNWEKHTIKNGVLCKIKNFLFKESDESLYLTLSGEITAEKISVIEQQEKQKNKIKDIILRILVFLNFIAILLGIQYGEKIKSFYNKSNIHKLVVGVIMLIILLLYLLFLLW